MGFISEIFNNNQTSPLVTDKYHLTTAYGYWLEGRADNSSTFYMFNRNSGTEVGYSVVAGLEGIVDALKRWQEYGFLEDDIEYLRATQNFPDEFLAYLKSLQFKLQVDALPEGTFFFPQEPVIRVQGPLVQAKLFESIALCIMNSHSAYATHAVKMTEAIQQPLANGSPMGFASIQGLRRGPTLGAAIEASRSLYLGGYTSTSTGIAAKMFGMPFAGTMDHAWVMTHDREIADLTCMQLQALQQNGNDALYRKSLKSDAFRSFALAFLNDAILLVDTYDPIQGLENAIIVIKELRQLGHGKNYGIRFDSGDITSYTKIALRRFAEEGLVTGLSKTQANKLDDTALLKLSGDCTVFCVASDGIDDQKALSMRKNGAFVKFWGIGTAASHAPPIGLAYKASEIYMNSDTDDNNKTPVMKVSGGDYEKSSIPGKINSRRFYNTQNQLDYIVLYDENRGFDSEGRIVAIKDSGDIRILDQTLKTRDLLGSVFDHVGFCVYRTDSVETYPGSGRFTNDLTKITAYIKSQLTTIKPGVQVFLDYNLYELRFECRNRHRENRFEHLENSSHFKNWRQL